MKNGQGSLKYLSIEQMPIQAKDVNASMKIAIDLYNCTSENCNNEQENVNKSSLSYIDAMKSKENKKLLLCQIAKCRQNAILQLTNFKQMYEKKRDETSKKACAYVDKLLSKPDKITAKQYVQAVTNFYF